MAFQRKKQGVLFAALTVLVSSLCGCSLQGYGPLTDSDVTLLQKEDVQVGERLAVVDTSMGSFTLRFFPSEAPLATENFISLAQQGYFDGQQVYQIAHDDRGAKSFLSGSPNSGISGDTIYGEPFDSEISQNLWPISGAVAALSDKDGQVDSRFFVISPRRVSEQTLKTMSQNGFPPKVVEAFRENGGVPDYSLHCTIFAQVIQGMDVVNRILAAPYDENSRPLSSIVINRVTIIRYEGVDSQ